MSEKQYYYSDENGNIHILTEDDLPKCPKTGGISPSVLILGDKKEEQNMEHINCRCSLTPYGASKGKRWYCIRHSKELTNEESQKCRGCESLSLTILKEINE